MRQYYYTIGVEDSRHGNAALARGLSPRVRPGLNAPTLAYCTGFRTRSDGLRKPVLVGSPFDTVPTVSGIHPQLFVGTNVALLAYEAELRRVDTYTWDYGTVVNTYNALSRDDLKSIPTGGGAWHFCEDQGLWCLFNDEAMVFKTGREAVSGETEKVYVNTEVRIKTGCAHKGRVFFGGFERSFFFPDEWSTEWQTWWDTTVVASLGAGLVDVDRNWVGWTSIGMEDFWFWFDLAFAQSGPVTSASVDDFYLEILRRNEAGFLPMPWDGEVLVMKPLGNDVIVYGDTGIARLFMLDETIGMQHLINVGVWDRGAVGGNDAVHVFVDRHGAVWRMEAGEGPQKMDYEDVFSLASGRSLAVSYNEVEGEFHISNKDVDADTSGATLYITPSGVSKHERVITSGFEFNGDFIGVYDDPAGFSSSLLLSEAMDLGSIQTKYVDRVEVGYNLTGSIDPPLVYLYTRSTPNTGSFVLYECYANDEGVAHFGVEGKEFKIGVVFSADYRDYSIDLSHIRVWYSYTSS